MAITVLGPVNITNTHHHQPNHKRSFSDVLVTALPSLTIHKSATAPTLSSSKVHQNRHSRRHSTIIPFSNSSSSLLAVSNENHDIAGNNKDSFMKNNFDFSLLSLSMDDSMDNDDEEQDGEESSENLFFAAPKTKTFASHFDTKLEPPSNAYDCIYKTPPRTSKPAAALLSTPPPIFNLMTPPPPPRVFRPTTGRRVIEIDHEQVPECILMPLISDDEDDDDSFGDSLSSWGENNNNGGLRPRMQLRFRPCSMLNSYSFE
jgi:hypothetical protein